MAMPTETDPLLLMQWLSPGFPIGAFSYSHGLEAAIEQGHISTPHELEQWLRDILTWGSGRNDAILIAQAYAGNDACAELAEALCPSAERRKETLQQGTAFAKTLNDVWELTIKPAPYPVVFGQAAKLKNLAPEPAIAAYLHAFAANLTSAAIRLVPLGQTDGQAVLTRLTPLCQSLAAEAQAATLDDLGGCAFHSDIASMQHETQRTRLFQS